MLSRNREGVGGGESAAKRSISSSESLGGLLLGTSRAPEEGTAYALKLRSRAEGRGSQASSFFEQGKVSQAPTQQREVPQASTQREVSQASTQREVF